jgi:hypothetical protein
VLIQLIKFLNDHPRSHPQQEFNRSDMARAIGTTPGTIAQLMGPRYKFAEQRNALLQQAGWKAVLRTVPGTGGSKQWFIRQ